MADLQLQLQSVGNDGSTPTNQNLYPAKIDEFQEIDESTKQSDLDNNVSKYVDLKNTNFEENETKYDNCMDTENYEENQARLNDFLKMSLHMSGEYSGNSAEYNQAKEENESDTSDDDNQSSSNEDDVHCEICQKTFLDVNDFNLHTRSRRMDDKRYKCCNCNKTFRDNTQLKVHARKHTGEKPFECNICGKKFTVNGNLNKHMRIHTGEKRFECADCGRKFTQFAHLEDHLKTHSGERPFVCSYCQSAFKTKARLRKHEKSHTDDKPSKRAVNCPKCSIVLKSNRQLATHLITHVQDSDGPFVCHLCGKAFAKFCNLQEHQKNHGDIKTFVCQCCDRAFSCASHLRRHMNSHSAFRLYSCDICHKEFPNGPNLIRHKRTHEGFRPYSCSVCKRPFPSSQNLKRHMMTHTGEKPFTCTDCDRGFLTLENLNRHRRTHTGEKPFACEVCGKLFAHSTTAKEHYLMVHTGEKPFGCTKCQKKFAISKMLYKHIRERHPDYFPQFKKEQNVTPNMKRAQEKIRMNIKCEDESDEYVGDSKVDAAAIANVKVKEEPVDDENVCESTNNCKMEDDKIKAEFPTSLFDSSCKTEATVKSETVGDVVKSEKGECRTAEISVKSEGSNIFLNSEDVDIPFVKVEKHEVDDM